MLEFNFNELDNDFITIWSNYILERNLESISGLEELAALGQVNAIQIMLLLGDSYLCRSVPALVNIKNNIKYLEDKEYTTNFNEEVIIKNANLRLTKTSNDLLIMPEIVHKGLSNDEHLKIVLKKHKDCYLETKNPLVLENYYEIKSGKKIVSRLNIKKLRKTLKDLYIQDTDNPSVIFAYAKNLYYFGNEEEKELGKKMLRSLAVREFSETLQDTILKRDLDKRERQMKRGRSKNYDSLFDTDWHKFVQ